MDTFLESFDEFVSQTSTVLGKLEQTEDTNDKLNVEIKSLLEENQECRNLNVLLTKKLNDKDLELQLVRRKYNERIEEEGGDITARAELVNTKHELEVTAAKVRYLEKELRIQKAESERLFRNNQILIRQQHQQQNEKNQGHINRRK